jgi:tRNA (cmo5U34)-methyltransferase
MATNGDDHTPHENGVWSFDESVTANFDTMLKNSIPEYENMRKLTFDLGKNFVDRISGVVDIGASRGEALAPFVNIAKQCYAVEVSEPMVAVLNNRFKDVENVSVVQKDLRQISAEFTPFMPERNCLVLSIFTLQFVPIEYRAKLLRTIYNSLRPGAAFILVEKVLGNTSDLDDLMVKEYYAMKNRNGYSYEDIQRKKASLEGVLVPMTDSWNREMMRNAGFSQIDCFYRSLNFCGLISIK